MPSLSILRPTTIKYYNTVQPPLITKKRKVLTFPKLNTELPPHSKLILHNDVNFKHSYVSKVISSIIPDMTHIEACDKATEAFLYGKSLLRVCPQDLAQEYCENIRKSYVKVSIEPVDFF
jgi:ATP-dependent Clp protease adapter protein ClpS